VIALPLSAILVGVGYVILPVVLVNRGLDVLETARLYLLYIPLNLVTLSLTSVLWGRMRLMEFNSLRIIVHLGFLVGIILLYIFNLVSVRRFAEVSLIATTLNMLMAAGLIWKNRWFGWKPDFQVIKVLLAYGGRIYLGSASAIANLRLDQMLMSIF